MSINCYLCGILIGEDHLETACYRYRAGYICTNCNETFLVKKKKLTVSKYDRLVPVRYIQVTENPPYAYHIENIELRMAIRKAILQADWYVWIQEKFLVSWIPPDKYQELTQNMGKGKADAISKSTVR